MVFFGVVFDCFEGAEIPFTQAPDFLPAELTIPIKVNQLEESVDLLIHRLGIKGNNQTSKRVKRQQPCVYVDIALHPVKHFFDYGLVLEY